MVKEKPLSSVQMARVLKAAERESSRDFCMLTIASNHAIRCSELAALRVSDVNVKDGVIYIRRLKGSNSESEKITAWELPVIVKWLNEKAPHDLLFPSVRGTQLCRNQVYRIFRRYNELVFNPDASRAPHAFRHSLGQAMADGGVDIKELKRIMGHKSIASTERYYEVSQNRVDETKERVLAARLKAVA